MPKRIQRSRARGWRMGDAIYVGRGSRWGNPFSVDVIGHAVACGLMTYGLPGGGEDESILGSQDWALFEAEIAVKLYRRFLELLPEDRRNALIAPLRDHDLACWCSLTTPEGKPVPCHADVLLKLANA